MWHNGVRVTHYYVQPSSQFCWAIFEGIGGWKRVRPGASGGVTNLGLLLSAARAHDRTVQVYLVDNQIERVLLS